MRAPSSRLAALVGALTVTVATGCGPVQSTSYLLDAETMLGAARTAQADKLAPYDWTAATLYLHKAQEEVGYSDFEQAVDYAKKAVVFATQARDNALRAGKPVTPVPMSGP